MLPPINPQDPAGTERSPYIVALEDLVVVFATSPQRAAILKGLLEFRGALHRSGFTRGFQWLDGSFIEHVELIEQRPPRDIDVVCFVCSAGASSSQQQQGDEEAFYHDEAKQRFLVDAYFVELDALSPFQLVNLSAYWYSMWSHRRTLVWKGFLQVDLSPDKDADARLLLDQICQTMNAGGSS